MNASDLAKVAAKFGLSKDVARLSLTGEALQPVAQVAQEASRVRQETKPRLNKLESDWLAVLRVTYPGVTIHSQSWRVEIASGAWYKVDHCAVIDGRWTAWECKGPSKTKGCAKGLLALKVAAKEFPEVHWILVWREDGHWKQQTIVA